MRTLSTRSKGLLRNRDLALGGNKLRKLEYVIPDAITSDADTLVSIGGWQSNLDGGGGCRQDRHEMSSGSGELGSARMRTTTGSATFSLERIMGTLGITRGVGAPALSRGGNEGCHPRVARLEGMIAYPVCQANGDDQPRQTGFLPEGSKVLYARLSGRAENKWFSLDRSG